LFFCGGGGSPGRFNLKLQLTDPRGTVVSNPQTSAEVINGELGMRTNTNIFLGFQGLVSGPGTYRVALIVNGVEHYSTTVTLDLPPKDMPIQ